MSKEAMKLALEALKELVAQTETGLFAVRHDHVAMQDARQAITALRKALAKPDFWEGYAPEPVKPAQQALDKKAENARELGLDYEPAQDSGIVTAGGFDPRTQRTWVGLTDEEIERVCVPLGAAMLSFTEVARAIEAKLRSKNENRN